jgi:hypothetical protein
VPLKANVRAGSRTDDGGRIVLEGRPADHVAARSTLSGEHLAAYVDT